MPPLRRPHDRYRGFRTRLRTVISANTDRDRHLMTAVRITPRKATRRARRSRASGNPTRLVAHHASSKLQQAIARSSFAPSKHAGIPSTQASENLHRWRFFDACSWRARIGFSCRRPRTTADVNATSQFLQLATLPALISPAGIASDVKRCCGRRRLERGCGNLGRQNRISRISSCRISL